VRSAVVAPDEGAGAAGAATVRIPVGRLTIPVGVATAGAAAAGAKTTTAAVRAGFGYIIQYH